MEELTDFCSGFAQLNFWVELHFKEELCPTMFVEKLLPFMEDDQMLLENTADIIWKDRNKCHN